MAECTICFEEFKQFDKTVICKNCNKKFHTSCYNRWNNIKKDNKCIFCMSKNTIINSNKKIFNKRDYCIYYCNIL